ncbi:MAG: Cys-Gln thioester bond-forming surface protein [Bacilli bacterium]|nr:Cys-Gln thioester bond-forming surface protein [Bacilli bacterium]
MKTLKKIAAGVISLALVIAITLGVASAATAPSSITVKRAEVLNDIITNHEHGFTIFTTSEGQYIYCMDVDKKALVSGQVATAAGNGDAGLLYILQNGYPYKTITGNDNIDKYVTQAAVWWYLDENKLSNEFKNATTTDIYQAIPKYIKPLVQGARSAKDTQATPSMKVSTGNSELTLTSDSKYYESEYMSATLVSASTYEVSLNGATTNTAIVSESGEVKSTFNSSEKFKVRVPASEVSSKLNITVNFKATGSVQKAKIFKPSDASYQRVVGLFDEVTSLSNTANLTVTPVKHVCEYTDGKYYGKAGNEVDKKTYNKECKHVCEYTDGKYYGKTGNEVDEKTFIKECKHVCEYTDGKYYGIEGKVVGKKTYEKECKKTCEYSDGKYYDKNGKVVDEKTFNKECKEQLTCAVVDGKYYDKNGNVVGEKTYAQECGSKHICEYTDNNYYGSNGQVVDQDTFNRQCGLEVAVPNTGSNVSPIAVALGIVFMAAGAYLIVYRKNQLS